MRVEWWRHPETLACGVRGHCVPADRHALPPQWAHLENMTVDGRRLGRCLRCGAWLPSETGPLLADLSNDMIPRRGEALREAIVLRAIAVERGIHSVVFGLAAIGLAILRLDLSALQSQARQLTSYQSGGFAGPGQAASQSTIVRDLQRLLNLRKGTLGVLVLVAIAYCVVEGTEAVGLWWERRWAEYLTALATAGLLPFEVDELLKHASVLKVSALIVNVAVLVYLVWRKHLFGVGGRRTEEDRVELARRR